MKSLEALVLELAQAIPMGAVGPSGTDGLGVLQVDVRLPVDSRLRDGRLQVSAPQGRLATGFEHPRGQVQMSFVRRQS